MAGIKNSQRFSKKLIEEWSNYYNKARQILTEQNYFINNNTQRYDLFELFWRYAPNQKTLSAHKLASAFLLKAVEDQQTLMIYSNYAKQSQQLNK